MHFHETAAAALEPGFELIKEGELSEMPALAGGTVLVCRYSPGFGRGDRDIVCEGPLHFLDLIERWRRADILNVRWYKAPSARFTVHARTH